MQLSGYLLVCLWNTIYPSKKEIIENNNQTTVEPFIKVTIDKTTNVMNEKILTKYKHITNINISYPPN